MSSAHTLPTRKAGSNPGQPPRGPDYVVVGTWTRDCQIAANGDLMFGTDGLGVPGGGGIYGAVGVRLWCRKVGIVGRAAEGLPQAWVEQVRAAGVDVAGVHRLAGVGVELIFSRWSADGVRRSYNPLKVFAARGITIPEDIPAYVALGRAAQVELIAQATPTPDEIPEAYQRARTFIVSAYPLAPTLALVESLRHHEVLIGADFPGPLVHRVDSRDFARLLAGIDVFMPSDDEIRAYYDPDISLSDCARRLADMGPKVVAIRMGRQGSLVYDRESRQLQHIPIYPAYTRDATGAGDAYCGGFMVGYTETGDAYQSGLYGTVTSSFIVEGPGALYALKFGRADAERRRVWLHEHLQSGEHRAHA